MFRGRCYACRAVVAGLFGGSTESVEQFAGRHFAECLWPADAGGRVTVFLQGLEKRGPDNRRKRIYMSAVTPDPYDSMYRAKIVACRDGLFSPGQHGQTGVKGTAIPQEVRDIGASFNAVLGYRDVTQQIGYDNYMTVRRNTSDFLKAWIDDRLSELSTGKTSEREKTFDW